MTQGIVTGNANAAVGGVGGGGFGVLLVWALNSWTGADLSGEQGAAIAAGAATLVLYIGRRGVIGVIRDFLYGAKK